ncbi:MAG: hypothetical protein RMJ98_09800, partial [Myxococcales bacterium]|nr:hypothetical protein [Polyangiaceae bacterium]MDW8249582.1 hypothetical protein [Myxococcales bacterium]
PLPFDNNASWNRGEREGSLDLVVTAGEDRRSVRLPMYHRFDCFYERRSLPSLLGKRIESREKVCAPEDIP